MKVRYVTSDPKHEHPDKQLDMFRLRDILT